MPYDSANAPKFATVGQHRLLAAGSNHGQGSPIAKAAKIQHKIAPLEAKKRLMQRKAERLLDGLSQMAQAITALPLE